MRPDDGFQHLGQGLLLHTKKPLDAGQNQESPCKCCSGELSLQAVCGKQIKKKGGGVMPRSILRFNACFTSHIQAS